MPSDLSRELREAAEFHKGNSVYVAAEDLLSLLDQLCEARENTENAIANGRDNVDRLHQRLRAKADAAEGLAEALRWYANRNRYRVGAWPQDDGTDGSILPDEGERAREALARFRAQEAE